MNTDELSTGGGSPSAKSKKREGEKRKSPCTPLREKGKGKEQSRVSSETQSKPARAYARRNPPCTCTYDEAGDAVAEIIGNCFGTAVLEEALKKLSERDQAFVLDVLDGKGWRELELGKRGFNKRLAKICSLLGSHPPSKSSL